MGLGQSAIVIPIAVGHLSPARETDDRPHSDPDRGSCILGPATRNDVIALTRSSFSGDGNADLTDLSKVSTPWG